MDSGIWFGNLEHVEYIKCALQEWGVDNKGYAEVLNYVNGGAGVVRSFASARSYDLSWRGTPDELNPIKAWQQGFWGPGPYFFADPLAFETNMFPPNWATPRLIETGDWKSLYTTEPTFSTAANGYNQPLRYATWAVNETSYAIPDKVLTILIPPTHTLHLGYSGAVTGTGRVGVRPINVSGSFASPTSLTPLTASGATRMNASFSGSTYRAVQIYLTSSGSATVSIVSMMAQLWPTGVSPTLTGNHISGEGVMGLEFTSGITETYYHTKSNGLPARKGASVKLQEVEPWL